MHCSDMIPTRFRDLEQLRDVGFSREEQPLHPMTTYHITGRSAGPSLALAASPPRWSRYLQYLL